MTQQAAYYINYELKPDIKFPFPKGGFRGILGLTYVRFELGNGISMKKTEFQWKLIFRSLIWTNSPITSLNIEIRSVVANRKK
jgi:hypothetical protein